MKILITSMLAIILSLISLVYGDVEWTRLKGEVKAFNLKTHNVTIENKDGDLFTVPLTEDVTIIDSKNAITSISGLTLNEKVTLLHIQKDKEVPDTEGLALPKYPHEPSQH